jgi:hypothetical protein
MSDNIPIEFLYESLIAERLNKQRQNSTDYLYKYSDKLIDYIIKDTNNENLYIKILSKYIYRILNDCDTFYNIKDDQIIDLIKELNTYATIFVNNNKYTNIYHQICKKLKNIHKSYPVKDVEWINKINWKQNISNGTP